VIHHQLPEQIEYYTHRSGRTGRAGKKGISLVLIDPRERAKIDSLENELAITFMEWK
jgi:ATP-dependent RNA helicase DeaD